jgi:hypothetical protein
MVWVLKANTRGPQGHSIVGTTIRPQDGHLVITLSNGTTLDAGYARGRDGIPGPGSVTNDVAGAALVDQYDSLLRAALDRYYGRKTSIQVEEFGATSGVNSFDNTAAFREAVAAGIAQDRRVEANGSSYSFKPNNGIIIPISTGVALHGGGEGVTTFRIQNGASVPWKAFIGSNNFGTDDLSDLELSGFTFDYNTVGNPVPNVASLDGGMVRAVVMAPKGDRLRLKFRAINGDGIWVAQLGTTIPTGAAAYRVNDSYIDLRVHNFGINSAYHDSSAVYFYGDRNTVRGTYHAAATAPGAICAIEVHGDAWDVQVTVDGFAFVSNATGCDATTNHTSSIHDCIGRNLLGGIAIWSVDMVGASGYGIDGMHVMNNILELDPDRWSGTGKSQPPGNYAHFGIGLSSHGANDDLPIRNLKIKGNTVTYKPGTQTVPKSLDAGISLIRNEAMAGNPKPDMNIDVSDNNVDSPLSAGVVIDLKNKAINVRADDMSVRNPAANGVGNMGALYASGVVFRGDIVMGSADNVDVIDDRDVTIANSAVDMSGVTSGGIARLTCLDPKLHSVTPKAPIVGPSAAGAVATRYFMWGWVEPLGNLAYGSRVIDYANGHEHVQTAVPGGATWAVSA